MAITILQTPKRFTPSGSPVVFQVQTDNADLRYFRCEVIDNATGFTIKNLDIMPRPNLTNGSFTNLSTLLDDVVGYQVDNDSSHFVSAMTKPVRAYRMKITERVKGADGKTVDGAVYNNTSDVYYVFSAGVDRISFNSFDDDQYVVKSGNFGVKFLSYKPLRNDIFKQSAEYLYFLNGQSGPVNVKVQTYASNGTLLNTYTESCASPGTTNMYRINVSPRAIKKRFGVSLVAGQHYTVQLFNASTSISELRTYDVIDSECQQDLMNVIWVNSLGGVDAYTMVNPQQSLKTDRVNIKRNVWDVIGGIYTSVTGDTYNPSEQVLSNKSSVKVAFNTRPLDDQEVAWLGEMVTSKMWFVELTDGKLIPGILDQNTFTYKTNKYLRKPNEMQFSITFADGFIPALSNGGASFIMNTEFTNTSVSAYFTKQGCNTPSEYGEQVLYTVPAGMFSSELSQSDAQQQAIDYMNSGVGQAYANSQGSCLASATYGNIEMHGTYYSSVCGAGTSPEPYTYTVPANTYTAYSQSAANALAIQDLANNGQAEADANGTCATSVGNDYMSDFYFNETCGAGTEPDAYEFEVLANTYFAATKAEANQLAASYMDSQGQTEANANGGCSPLTNSISLIISLNKVASGVGYTDIYYTVQASAPVTQTISVRVNGHHPSLGNLNFHGTTVDVGTNMSYEEWGGQYPDADAAVITASIYSVFPNPDYTGTSYTF